MPENTKTYNVYLVGGETILIDATEHARSANFLQLLKDEETIAEFSTGQVVGWQIIGEDEPVGVAR